MNFVKEFKCVNCEKTFEIKDVDYICPECSSNLEVIFDYEGIKKRVTREWFAQNKRTDHFRYSPFMPLEMNEDLSPKEDIPVPVGGTPLIKSAKMSEELGVEIYLKDEGKNPSASLKDRASSVALLKAIEDGAKIVTGASTGNAGSSMACLCAAKGMKSVIFLPKAAPKAKVAQLLLFGSNVIAVEGNYDAAFDLCLKVSDHYGWVNRNTGYNPYTREGKKTVSFEILEQLNFEVPDYVAVSVGDGNIISGVYKGFCDFYKAGLVDKIPKIIAVQSEKSNAIAQAINVNNGVLKNVKATTIADSISVDQPRDGQSAVKAVLESKGIAVEVTDEEILANVPYVASRSGVFGEPAGVASVAGIRKLIENGSIPKNSKIVAIITGNGLKDVDSALKVAGNPHLVEPDLEIVKEKFKKLNLQ